MLCPRSLALHCQKPASHPMKQYRPSSDFSIHILLQPAAELSLQFTSQFFPHQTQSAQFAYTFIHFVYSPHFNFHEDRQAATIPVCQNTLNTWSFCLQNQHDDIYYQCSHFFSVISQIYSLTSTFDVLNSSPWQPFQNLRRNNIPSIC